MSEAEKVKLVKTQNIFLVGPLGAGKTTIGRYLARALNRDFYDSDHEIEVRTGADITWIFDIEGEEGFRERETQVIDDLTQKQGIVVSTGGGAVLRSINRKILSARGLVIYLQVSIEQQLLRTVKDQKRPLLRTDDRLGMLKKMYQERTELYEEVSDLTCNTDQQTPRTVANKIIKALQ